MSLWGGGLSSSRHWDATRLDMDSVGEELERLARLRASGDLTDGEFQSLKARLIGTEPNAPAPSEQIPIPTTEGVEENRDRKSVV